MLRTSASIALLCLLTGPSVSYPTAGDEPEVRVKGHRLSLLAREPDIATPVGMAALANGDLLVLESHTHQRDKDYSGPESDRVRRFADSDGDGVPDRWVDDFASGYRHALNVAARPDGAVYLVTRRDVRLLSDRDGDGKAELDEVIVRLESDVDYPHNALGGIWLSGNQLYLGMGENFGGRYALIGSDGSSFSDEGGCGRVFVCQPDGSKLRKYASGFWNPFGLCAASGRVYCIDNDPDASPPCRLLEVQAGDDFGYRYEYHRAGLHPLQAWDGELPGTKGMVSGVGEAPTGIVAHRGWLWVTSWGEHRIERYRLRLVDGVVKADREVVVQGLSDFRPTGIAVGLDGALYFGDWVSRSYPVHGKGRLWRLELPESESIEPLPAARQRSLRARLLGPDGSALNPYGELRVAREEERLSVDLLRRALESEDAALRLCAVRYAADMRADDLGDDVRRLIQPTISDPREYMALVAALEWLDPEQRSATSTGELMARHLADEGLSSVLQAIALRNTPPDHDVLRGDFLTELLRSEHSVLRAEAVWTLALQSSDGRFERLAGLATDPREAPEIRAIAVSGLALDVERRRTALESLVEDPEPSVAREASRILRLAGLSKPMAEERPASNDLNAWIELLEHGGDVDSGRRLFLTTTGPNCAACHRHSGRGAAVGPDLTRVGNQQSRARIVTSILRPSAEIAPRYEPWVLTTSDGALHTGFLLPQSGDNGQETYMGTNGHRFTLRADEVEDRYVSDLSIMPDGFENALTVDDLRDLVAFLAE